MGDIIRQENVGDLEFACVREFGNAWRLRAPFRVRYLIYLYFDQFKSYPATT